jgi:hypothetical protein
LFLGHTEGEMDDLAVSRALKDERPKG